MSSARQLQFSLAGLLGLLLVVSIVFATVRILGGELSFGFLAWIILSGLVSLVICTANALAWKGMCGFWDWFDRVARDE